MDHPDAPGQIFNVASGKNYSVKEIYAMLTHALKSDIQPVFREASMFWDKYPGLFSGSYPLPKKLIEKEVNKYTLGSAEKALRILGWKAQMPMEEGIRITAEYAKKIQ
jgi:nucleoside-diphosphate-sugar epimerase